jgi:hypothetical protein
MIGVPLLTLEEYTTVVVQSDVLTDEEQLCVFKAITMKNNSVFNITTRFRMHSLSSTIHVILLVKERCKLSRYLGLIMADTILTAAEALIYMISCLSVL